MWTYVLRRILYNVPVYLGILLLLMIALRVNDPVWGYLGKNASEETYLVKQAAMGLDQPFARQYVDFVGKLATFDFTEESWSQPGLTVGEIIRDSIVPSLSITLPALLFTSLISIVIAIVSSYYRGPGVRASISVWCRHVSAPVSETKSEYAVFISPLER